MISRAINEQYPGDGIISEELHNGYEDSTDRVWIIDPLDGTTNFSLGLPIWGVSIAHVISGVPSLGVIYFPMLNELYHTQRGSGAYFNDERIQTKPGRTNDKRAFFSCCSHSHNRYEIRIPYKTRIMGAATYSWCAVARGIALIGLHLTTKIWDIAAGCLLVEEAGGVSIPLGSQTPFPLVAGKDYNLEPFPTLVTASVALAEEAQAKLKPKKPL
jgi:myo-inositol-1(or 4)-monophosphatase